MSEGPYRVGRRPWEEPGPLFFVDSPRGRKNFHSPLTAGDYADELNLASRLALEEAIGVVRKYLPFEMGDAVEADLRALISNRKDTNAAD